MRLYFLTCSIRFHLTRRLRVTAYGAYDKRKCHDASADRNAHAVFPPRKNAKLWKPGARARTETLRSSKYLDRALRRQLTGYHRRSRDETKMPCVKLLGQRLSARDFDRQVAGNQISAVILTGPPRSAVSEQSL